jgi:tRNA(Ser,Leu) C12 N-acetylase TAN1
MWRQARIRRAKAEIDSQKSAAALSITVLNSRTDEAIRRMALTRIKTLETVSQNDMDNLEEAVGELLTRESNTDKLLAIELAETVRVAGLRALSTS